MSPASQRVPRFAAGPPFFLPTCRSALATRTPPLHILITLQLESRFITLVALSFALTPSDATPNSRQPPQLSGHVSRRGVRLALQRLASPCCPRRPSDESPTQNLADRGLCRTRARARDTRPHGDRAQLARLLPGRRHVW